MRQGSGNSESQRHTESTKPGPVRGWLSWYNTKPNVLDYKG